MNRRCILLAAAVLLAAPLPAMAQTEYPAKPVSLIVPFSAGGRTDVVGRIVAQHLQTALGKPVEHGNHLARAGAGCCRLCNAARHPCHRR